MNLSDFFVIVLREFVLKDRLSVAMASSVPMQLVLLFHGVPCGPELTNRQHEEMLLSISVCRSADIARCVHEHFWIYSKPVESGPTFQLMSKEENCSKGEID